MTISEGPSTSRGSELYFNDLLKVVTATLRKSPQTTGEPTGVGPLPHHLGLSSSHGHSHLALGLALTVTGAHLPTLDSLSLFFHRDLFSVDWVEVRTLTLTLILSVSVANSLLSLGFSFLICEVSVPLPPLSSDISEPSWNLYSEILWLIGTNPCFTKCKWLYEVINPVQLAQEL